MHDHRRDDDIELLRLTAGGDRQAFSVLVDRHEGSIWRFVRCMTRDPARAEDVLQETFLAAWRYSHTYDGAGSARAWLFTIARNCSVRGARRRSGEPDELASLEELGIEAGWQAQESPEDLTLRREQRLRLRKALESLPAEYRVVLVLRDLEGLSGPETASVLGLGLGAMKSRLHRSRLSLAASLRKGGHH